MAEQDDFERAVTHPSFAGLPLAEQQKVLTSLSPSFAALPGGEQLKVIKHYTSMGQPSAVDQPKGMGERILEGGKNFLAGVGAGLLSTGRGAMNLATFGQGEKVLSPQVKAQLDLATTPPPGPAGGIGFGAEQATEALLAPETRVGAGMKGVKGLLTRAGAQAVRSGAVSAVQTGGDPKAVGVGAAFGAGGQMAGEGVSKGAKAVYGQIVGHETTGRLKDIRAMQGTAQARMLPITDESVDQLAREIGRNKQEFHAMLTDPAHPLGMATIPVDDVLRTFDDYARSVRMTDPQQYNHLMDLRKHWVKELDIVPSQTVTTPSVNFQGQTSYGSPRPANQPAMTTVAKAQELKEALDKVAVKTTAYKGNMGDKSIGVEEAKRMTGGLREGIEEALPNTPVAHLNDIIHRDIMYKDAIEKAVKRNPSFLQSQAAWILGLAAGSAVTGGAAASGHSGAQSAGEGAAIGALTVMAVRNPRVASRLAIALDQVGVRLPVTAPAFGGTAVNSIREVQSRKRNTATGDK